MRSSLIPYRYYWNQRTLLFVLAISLVSFECTFAGNSLIPGDYISQEYLDNLRSTFSPMAANKLGHLQSLKIISTDQKLFLQTIYDFNEGGQKYQVLNDDSVHLIEGKGLNPSFKKIDSATIVFTFGDLPKKTFNYTAHLEQIVGSICLSGEYKNSANQKLSFYPNGTWCFKNKTNPFKIGMFYPPSFRLDYFITDTGEVGFKRVKDTLQLFNTIGGSLFEDGKIDLDHPEVFLRLSPASNN